MPSLICLVLFAASLPDMLAERLAPMASNRTVKAEYRQEREFKGLSMKLVVRGTMAYERGKGLVWSTSTPIATKTVITSDSIVQWSAESGRAVKIDAESLPFIRPLFDCQNAWFGGDFTSIPGFRIESFSGRRLALSAVDGVAGSMFSRIEIDFSEDFTKVCRVRMAEKTGDEMVLTFDKTANNVELPPSTWECP